MFNYCRIGIGIRLGGRELDDADTELLQTSGFSRGLQLANGYYS